MTATLAPAVSSSLVPLAPEILCLTWPTLMSYLRIATHPRIFSAPLTPEESLANVTALIGLPHVRAVSELDGFLDAYR